MKIPCSKDLETTAAVARCSDFPGLQGGLPHSEIVGSKLIRSSPTLIAAYHVLHRLCMPRHPPVALKTLDRSHCQCPSIHVPEDRRSEERYMDHQKDRGEPQAFKRWHWHKKTSFSRSVRGPRSGKPISCRELSVPGDEPPALPPGRRQGAIAPLAARLRRRNPNKSSLHDVMQNRRRPFGLPQTFFQVDEWWSRTGSNRRPPACKAGALPAELRPR